MTLTPKQSVGEKGVTNVVFAIVIGFIVIFVAIGIVYIVLSDRLNGLDAYRTKALFDNIKAQKEACDFNAMKLQAMQEWVRQQKGNPPPDLITIKPCLQLPQTEAPK